VHRDLASLVGSAHVERDVTLADASGLSGRADALVRPGDAREVAAVVAWAYERDLAIVPVGYHKSAAVREAADRLYEVLRAAGIDVLIDDRDERPGVMFADMELIGIPHRVVVGERGLKDGKIEYQARRDQAAQTVELEQALAFLQERLCPGNTQDLQSPSR